MGPDLVSVDVVQGKNVLFSFAFKAPNRAGAIVERVKGILHPVASLARKLESFEGVDGRRTIRWGGHGGESWEVLHCFASTRSVCSLWHMS